MKGVLLVSEVFTEINAGLVLQSGHTSPATDSALRDSERHPDHLAEKITNH